MVFWDLVGKIFRSGLGEGMKGLKTHMYLFVGNNIVEILCGGVGRNIARGMVTQV